jgi:uncharacterized repeat protein (TIGR01451 family)
MINRIVPTLALVGLVATAAAVAPSATGGGQDQLERRGLVVAVSSGDTLLVRTLPGRVLRVHLVGIRAETCDRRQALAETRRLVLGRHVVLVEDLSQGSRAPDGALFAYVRLPRRFDLGSRLVRGGFASIFYRQPFARLPSYRLAEIAAQNHGRGLWLSSACSDVSMGLSTHPSPVTLGNKLSYELGVQNKRPLPTQVTIKLSFSAPVTVSTDEPGCSSSGETEVVCRLALDGGWTFATAALRSGAHAQGPAPRVGSRTVSLSVSPAAPGELTARAEASTTKPDPTPADNSATITTTVKPGPASADLALAMSSTPQPAQAGNPLTLTVTVTNLGPSEATGVVITDPLPAGIESPLGISCFRICFGIPGFAGPAELAPGQSGIATIMARHSPAAPITNSASVSASTPDPNPGNNAASITTTLGPAAPDPNLALTVNAAPTTVRVGQQFVYVLTVSNNGPGAAPDVGLQNSPTPANEAELLAARPSQGSCTRELACELGPLAAGAKATLRLSYRARHVGYGSFDDNANVGTSALPDPFLGFITGPYAHASVTIVPAAPPTFVLGSDKLGPLQLSAQTSPSTVTDAFGAARDIVRAYGEFCARKWGFGLTITFANFVGQDPCGSDQGLETSRLLSATMRGRRWTTSRGLQIGDEIGRLHRLYPQAQRHGSSYWLLAKRSPYGNLEAALAAIVWSGRVHAFAVNR